MPASKDNGRAEAAQTDAVLRDRRIHEEWRDLYRRDDVAGLQRSYLEEIVARLGLAPGTTIFDAGCGTAFNAVRLAEMGFRVEGIDLSQAAIEAGRDYAVQRNVADRVRLRQGDLTKLEIADASFEAIICFGVLMHVPNFDAAVGELARVLKPGGALVLLEGNAQSPENMAQRAYWKRFRRQDIRVEESPGLALAWIPSAGGSFVVRNVSVSWLTKSLERVGLELEWSRTGDLTELYARRWVRIRKALIALNRLWFRAHGPARLASGFFACFRKRGG